MNLHRIFLIALVSLLFTSIGCTKQQAKQIENISQSEQQKMKKIEELINTEENGFDYITELFSGSKNKVEILPYDKKRAERVLYETQVTTRSPMGAIIYETGGILIDKGWLRILGSGSDKLNRELSTWNKGKSFVEFGEQPSFLLVADDVIGGFFAINGGGLSKENIGKIFYFAPDNLEWECTNLGYSEFIQWAFTGDIHKFYEPFYWNGYESDLAKMNGNESMSFFPFLFTKEGKDINKTSKKIVPIDEIWKFELEYDNKDKN